MSDKELNAYRLTSMDEPTDEMLAMIMHEAAVDAKLENEAAHKKLFDEIGAMIREKEAQWNIK